MVKMYFDFKDEELDLQDKVLDDMVKIANKYEINLVVSYKDYKMNKGKKIHAKDIKIN